MNEIMYQFAFYYLVGIGVGWTIEKIVKLIRFIIRLKRNARLNKAFMEMLNNENT